MTKEDLAELLIHVGNALMGVSSKSEELAAAETGTIGEVKQEQPIQLQQEQTKVLTIPEVSSKIKEIFATPVPDPYKEELQIKEQEIQKLRDQINALQQNNNQTTGNIG